MTDNDKAIKKPEWEDKVPVELLDSFKAIVITRKTQRALKFMAEYSLKTATVAEGSKIWSYGDCLGKFAEDGKKLKIEINKTETKRDSERVMIAVTHKIEVFFSKKFLSRPTSTGLEIAEEINSGQTLMVNLSVDGRVTEIQRTLRTIQDNIMMKDTSSSSSDNEDPNMDSDN